MNIAVFGLGYVGFTVMCCLTKQGHSVVGVDIDPSKVKSIREGIAPILEPGVDHLLAEARLAGTVMVTTEVRKATSCEIFLICVGTPSAKDGSLSLRHIEQVTGEIAQEVCHGKSHITVVYRSTLPPGTMESIVAPIFARHLGDNWQNIIELVYNPEFLREGTAIADYFVPPKVVVGTKDGRPSVRLESLNADIQAETFVTEFKEAEVTKFVDNTWHALKVAFANEIGRICLAFDINVETVHRIFVSDRKLNISTSYTKPGGAFGGSCLPKDVRGLQSIASKAGVDAPVIMSIMPSNEAHKAAVYDRAVRGLSPGSRVLVVGLAFKAGTDDLRESPSVDLVTSLLQVGFAVSVYDDAVSSTQLVGENKKYIDSRLPELAAIQIDRRTAETSHYDRVVLANRLDLTLRPGTETFDISALD